MKPHINDLSPVERQLVDALEAGDIFALVPHNAGAKPIVRAEVVRNLLRHVYEGLTPDPKGLRMRHVRIEGRLDLDHIDTRIPLELDWCELPGGISAVGAQLSLLRLRRLSIHRDSSEGAVLDFENLRAETVDLTGTTIIEECPPVVAVGPTIDGDGRPIHSNSMHGAVHLRGAAISGQLILKSAQLTNTSGPALHAEGLTVTTAFLDEGFLAQGHGRDGAIRLAGATITGSLSLSGAKLTNSKGSALYAAGLTVAADFRADGLSAQGHGYGGAVHLNGATIKGKLNLSYAKLTNHRGPALYAEGLTVGADALLDDGFSAQGWGHQGAVCLSGAAINGSLKLSLAKLTNPKVPALLHGEGPALHADGLTVAADFLADGLTARGHGSGGAVRLRGATIGGELNLTGARLTNTSGPALDATRLAVKFGCCIDLLNSDIGQNESPQLREQNSEQAAPTTLPTSVVLTGANLGATLEVSISTLEAASGSGGWSLAGLIYDDLETKTAKSWLDFLKHGTREYSLQPYQQFAAVARAQGDENLTRKILIAQRNDQLFRSRKQHGLLTRRQRAGLWILRGTVGYGYKTWMALVWLAFLVLVAVGVTFAFGTTEAGALLQPEESKAGSPNDLCRPIDLWILGLETIPLIPLVSGVADKCDVTATPEGGAYLAVSILLKGLAWALVTLFAAGYSNIVRKPGP